MPRNQKIFAASILTVIILLYTSLQRYEEVLLRESIDYWTRDYYAMQAASRISGLESIRETTENFLILYNAIVPEVLCRNLVRVGNVLDGGKWVCNPRAMPRKNCSIYSLGLHEDVSFDHDIQEINNFACRLYGYDQKKQTASTIQKYQAMNGEIKTLKIGPRTKALENIFSIGDLVSSNNDESVEFLKIDIEGAERRSLIPFLKLYKVCQVTQIEAKSDTKEQRLFVEIHGLPLKHVTLLNQIARLDYALFSYEVNGYYMTACEYSFIHRECMSQYGASDIHLYLKHVKPSTI